MADALSLPHLPLVMECFDISNISTTHIVASMVAFKNGIPDKANYRRFRIKGVKGQNDFASMAEVVRRRYARVLQEARELHPDVAEYSQENPQEATGPLAPREREPCAAGDAGDAGATATRTSPAARSSKVPATRPTKPTWNSPTRSSARLEAEALEDIREPMIPRGGTAAAASPRKTR